MEELDVYISLYTLNGVLPMEHYTCWSLFVDACHRLLKPSISLVELYEADNKLLKFVAAFMERFVSLPTCIYTYISKIQYLIMV